MKENLLTINVSLADYSYPILINREEEEIVRKAAKLINEKILEFKKVYTNGAESKISSADYLAMAAMQVSIEFVRLGSLKDIDLLAEKIQVISQELDEYLKSEE
jgi:cell division protein ZapA